jgi:hypothetical protein
MGPVVMAAGPFLNEGREEKIEECGGAVVD